MSESGKKQTSRANGPELTVADLAAAVGGRAEGDPSAKITGLAGLLGARPGEVSFVSEEKYARRAAETAASALLVPEPFEAPAGCKAAAFIRVPDVAAALESVIELFPSRHAAPASIQPPPWPTASSSARTSPSARVP